MPIITPESLDTALKHGNIEPVYLLFGEEEFLIEEALERLLATTVDESTRSFNFDVLHGSETTLNEAVEKAQAYPLMAERRVVVIKDIDRLFALRGKPDKNSPFARYLANPAPSTVLVMSAATGDILSKGKSAGTGKAPYDLITNSGTCVQFKKVYDRDLPSWTATRIKSRGKEITPDAVELFVGYSGSSLRVLQNEIEKLFTFVEDRKRITADDVRAVVGVSKTYNVFELQKAMGNRNMELSIEITEQMLRNGESEQLILTMLGRYFTTLWKLTEIRATMKDQNQIARAAGISPFFLNEYLAALTRYPLATLHAALEAILRADILLKSSNSSPSTTLHLMLVEILSRR